MSSRSPSNRTVPVVSTSTWQLLTRYSTTSKWLFFCANYERRARTTVVAFVRVEQRVEAILVVVVVEQLRLSDGGLSLINLAQFIVFLPMNTMDLQTAVWCTRSPYPIDGLNQDKKPAWNNCYATANSWVNILPPACRHPPLVRRSHTKCGRETDPIIIVDDYN